MEPLLVNEVPIGSGCGMHGTKPSPIVGCKHVYMGKAGTADITVKRGNHLISCAKCSDNWDDLTYYCPECYRARIRKYYPSYAKIVDEWCSGV